MIYDPELTLDLPPALSASSGMNAIAHSVEALYAQDAQPGDLADGRGGYPRIGEGSAFHGRNPEGFEREIEALYGAWLCGVALGSAGMALHHKLCHVLGGSFNLPHAETHSIVLPHAMRYNYDGAREAMARVERALGSAVRAGAVCTTSKRSWVCRCGFRTSA